MLAASDPAPGLADEAKAIVRTKFFDPVRSASVDVDRSLEPHAAIRRMLASLGASHTALYGPDDWEYVPLLSIFEDLVPSVCKDHLAALPPRPFQVGSIGAYWKKLGDRWFTIAVIPGSEAERSGLRIGDEAVLANGAPFDPVTAFRGRAGSEVTLDVRRTEGGATRKMTVRPALVRSQEEFLGFIDKGHRLITAGRHRVGYVSVFAWTSGDDTRGAVTSAIADLHRQGADAWIVDLRDGMGGAAPEDAAIFSQDIAPLTTVARDGTASVRDSQIRGPAVVLINGGTRSGKELVAFEVKRAKMAVTLGEKTAGAVLAGAPFCLSDGSLMYLATSDVRIGGVRLEGKGVEPDIVVPWDLRYAGGVDAQLAAALAHLGRL
jgi:carboxyl-terminal processing protease